MARPPLPGNHLQDLIRKRIRDLKVPNPVIYVPRSFAVGRGQSADEFFLGHGMQLYVDSVFAQTWAPPRASANSAPYYDQGHRGQIEVQLRQPSIIPAAAEALIYTMQIPVWDREPQMEVVRSAGFEVRPGLPLVGRVRVNLGDVGILHPESYTQVTVLFAVEALPRD